MSARLAELLLEYLEEPLVLGPSDASRESSENTVWFQVPEGSQDQTALASTLVAIGEALRARFRGARPPATFYAWYDEQAGQLRCALRSVGTDDLPFRAAYEVVVDPAPVVASLVSDAHAGFVPWDELTAATGEGDGHFEAAHGPKPRFPVFVVPIAVPAGRA